MNKQQLKDLYWVALKELAELDALGPVVVGAGGALLMLGLREETDDLDLEVTQDAWDTLVNGQGCVVDTTAGVEIIRLLKGVDIHLRDDHSAIGVDIREGVLCSTLLEILALKQRLNREKDKVDIAKIQAYLDGE